MTKTDPSVIFRNSTAVQTESTNTGSFFRSAAISWISSSVWTRIPLLPPSRRIRKNGVSVFFAASRIFAVTTFANGCVASRISSYRFSRNRSSIPFSSMRPSWTWRFGASGISSFPYSVATKTSARTLLPASLSARSRPSVVPAKIAIFFSSSIFISGILSV